MVQIIKSNGGGGGGSAYTAGNGIDISAQNEISVDTEVIATKQDLTTKQDVISDLDTIRSDASAGKSAKDTIDTYGDIVTHNVSEFATAAQGGKADTALQPNDNVSELVNNAGYLVSSDLKQSNWGQSDSSAIDYIKNKPTIGNATLTIQKNGTTVNSITMNSTSNVTANISVPTDTSDLTNGAGFITNSALSGYQTTANMVTSLSGADDDHYPTALAVANAISSSGGGDVMGPASSTDGDIVLFDGATGKAIKDSSKKLSDYQDKLTTQTAYTSKGTASKVPQITTNTLGQVTGITEVDINYPTQVADTAYASSWDGVTTTAPSKNAVYDKINSMDTAIGSNTSAISTINGKIPSAATSSNQLADKNYVNDSINSVTAYYITKDAQGNQWATRAELFAATTFYSGGVVRVPTKNDYTIVLADEQHDNATTRYIYNNSWEYQYTVNETALTQAQLDALNSGITSGKVTSYDSAVSTIAGYGNIVTHNTSEFATSAQGAKADSALQSGDDVSELVNDAGYITSSYHDSSKQDALTLPATPTQGNLVTWGADNETLVDGGAVPTGVPSGGNNGDVLTNVSGTPTWQAPSSGGITNETTGTTTTVTKIWAGTEAEYALITPNATTIYYVF